MRFRFVGIAGAMFVASCIYFIFDFCLFLSDNKISNAGKDAVVFVYPESDVDSVLATIVEKAEMRRPASLRRAFEDKKVAEHFEPGRYEIKEGATSVYIARMLNNGWQTPGVLVLSGSLRSIGRIASKISSQMMIDSASIASALENPELLSKYGVTPSTAFSLFIPDTYGIYWTASADEILGRMKGAYDFFWNNERLSKAGKLGLSPMEVITLASIVSGETNYIPEMPMVAGVYLNRLKKGMKLQADPTVAFCYDYSINRILKKHLQVDSPYNTYKYKGLPPGPICSPSADCIDAVLNPEGSYLYFCADPSMNGRHRFTASYRDHLKNARDFQKALNQLSCPAK